MELNKGCFRLSTSEVSCICCHYCHLEYLRLNQQCTNNAAGSFNSPFQSTFTNIWQLGHNVKKNLKKNNSNWRIYLNVSCYLFFVLPHVLWQLWRINWPLPPAVVVVYHGYCPMFSNLLASYHNVIGSQGFILFYFERKKHWPLGKTSDAVCWSLMDFARSGFDPPPPLFSGVTDLLRHFLKIMFPAPKVWYKRQDTSYLTFKWSKWSNKPLISLGFAFTFEFVIIGKKDLISYKKNPWGRGLWHLLMSQS